MGMTNRQTWLGRAAAAFSALVVLATAGCASNNPNPRPPYPTDIDPCASYCLVWVPPVYVDVPRVTTTRCGGVCHEKVPVQKTCFEEVCVPGRYEKRCVPCERTTSELVQVTPARDEWKSVNCPCEPGCCWKREHVPAEYKCCEKTETKNGYAYCAFTPPQYDIVARTKTTCEERTRYVPAEYGVVYEKHLYEPGHWVWKAKYGCKEPCQPCKTKLPDCGRACGGCDCRGIPAAN